MNDTIQFDATKARQLVSAYKEAVQAGKTDANDVFVFEGHPLVIRYAEYLIEDLSNNKLLRPALTANELGRSRKGLVQ